MTHPTETPAPQRIAEDWRILRERQWDWHDMNLIVRPFVDGLLVALATALAETQCVAKELMDAINEPMYAGSRTDWMYRAQHAEMLLEDAQAGQQAQEARMQKRIEQLEAILAAIPDCPDCEGKGWDMPEGDICRSCDGAPYIIGGTGKATRWTEESEIARLDLQCYDLIAERADWRAKVQSLTDTLTRVREEAFRAGYHCRWHKETGSYNFDPLMAPGDPSGAYAAWLDLTPPPDEAPE